MIGNKTKIYKFIEKHENLIVLLLYILMGLFILRKLLYTETPIGFQHDWDRPYSVDHLRVFCNEALYAWGTHNLGYFRSYAAQGILQFLLLPLSYLGLSGIIVTKLLLLLIFVFSSYFMYFLIRRSFKLNLIPSFVSGIFFITTPVVFNKVVAGHINYLIGYALSPLVMLYFKKYVDDNQVRYLVITGLLIVVASIQIQFMVMLIFLILLYAILIARTRLKELIKVFLFLVVLISLTHFFWILPFFNTGAGNEVGLTLKAEFIIEDLRSWNTPLINAFRLIGYRSPHFEIALRSFEYKPIWDLCSILLLLLIFSSLLISKHKIPLFFAIVSIITLIFTTALSEPFGSLVLFLFLTFPVFSIFRELYHLTFLISFSYSVMLAYTIHSIHIFRKSKFLKFVSFVSLLSVITLNSIFIYSGDFDGQMQQYKFNSKDISVINEYQEPDEYYRVLYLPLFQPFKYDNLTFHGIDPVIRYSKKPTFGNYISSTSEFQRRIPVYLHTPSSKNIKSLLDILCIRYLFFRKNYQSMLLDYLDRGRYWIGNRFVDIRPIWTNENLFSTIINQKDIDVINETENIIVFENRNPLPYIYTSVNPIIIEGGLDEMMKVLEGVPSKTKFALLLSEQLGSQQLSQLSSPPINMQFIPLQSRSIATCDDVSKWIHVYGNFSFFSADTQDKQEGKAGLKVYGISDVYGEFRFAFDAPRTWNFREYTRLSLWLKANLTGWSDNQRVTLRDLYGYARAWDFSIPANTWTELVFPLKVYDYQDIGFDMSVINRIEITFEDQAKSNTAIEVKVDDVRFESPKPEIPSSLNDEVNQNITCTFTKENPTKYIVHVNASNPFFLVFSESFHKGWVANINGEEVKDHFIANGYANAWYINKTGSFDIILEFSPQRLFNIGVMISLTTFVFSILCISKDTIKVFYRRYINNRKLAHIQHSRKVASR